MPYKRINWTNTIDTPLNAQNLNKLDEGIYNNQAQLNSLEQLATYPNLASDCLKGNYSVTDETELIFGNGCLKIQSSIGTTTLSSDLTDVKTVDNNRLMLIKLRVKMMSGSNLSVYFKYKTNDNEQYVVKENIVASNLSLKGIGKPSYIIQDNEYHNVWCIFNAPSVTSITGVSVDLAPFAKAEISNFQAFYSLDEAGTSNESYRIVTATTRIIDANVNYEILSKSEVEIWVTSNRMYKEVMSWH